VKYPEKVVNPKHFEIEPFVPEREKVMVNG
jgi:hypothetical protein